MKQLLLISLFFAACQGGSSPVSRSETPDYHQQVKATQPDTLLAGIQAKITHAFVVGIISGNNDQLIRLGRELARLYETNKQPLVLYWRSYRQFFSSIYYLEKKDRKTAEKEIDRGIAWMKSLPKKNSEDYALLAMLQGFSIQFKPMKAMFIGPEATKNSQTAIALDSANLRAWYVYASNDFYTPEMFGGGRNTEKYLLKALSLPEQKVKNEYLPSWGKEESYELLVRYYIKKEDWASAKKYFQEAIGKFPDSYSLNKLAAQLVGR